MSAPPSTAVNINPPYSVALSLIFTPELEEDGSR